MQIYATNETRAFCAMDNHVKRSVLRSIKTKTVRIKVARLDFLGLIPPKFEH